MIEKGLFMSNIDMGENLMGFFYRVDKVDRKFKLNMDVRVTKEIVIFGNNS